MKNNLEIATYIGCKVLCKYCPQSIIEKAYKSRKKLMTLCDFKKLVKNVDNKKTRLVFAGFSEIFLNKYAVDMLIYASGCGFETDIYTTSAGLTKNKILKLKNAGVKLRFTAFHYYDSSVMPLNEEKFFNIIKFFKENIDCKAVQIIKVDKIFSRAGSLFKTEKTAGKIFCLRNFVYQNVVLPDGRLTLCCNDYKLRHILGNLYFQHYGSEEIELERQKILAEMENEFSETACRYCDVAEDVSLKSEQTFDIKRDFLIRR